MRQTQHGYPRAELAHPRRGGASPEDAHQPRWSVRTRLAVAAGGAAARLSRAARLGAGGVVGGQVVLALRPNALAELSRQHKTVLVTGTNGKTTTTAMLACALTELGPVVSNSDGANMPDGLIATLARHHGNANSVLEVDEAHLPAVLTATEPVMVLLLNLSRDQMDRAGEVGRTERTLRRALSQCPWVTVIANCDDILATSAAAVTRQPVWVSAGAGWHADAAACPRCGGVVHDRTGQWWCQCGFSRPRPDWTLQRQGLRTPEGRIVPFTIGVPGLANLGNAAMAAAAAVTLGASLEPALHRIGSVHDVAGRYRLVNHQDRRARLLLAKNPAGWRETLNVAGEDGRPVVLAINARAADGKDTSWLWDVSFQCLADRRVIVTGERAADLAVRLTYAEVPHTVVPDPMAAITAVPPGPVDVIGTYTAFRDIARRLGA